MHHMRFGDFAFNFNSDLSGDVYISKLDANEISIGESMEVPGEALIELVGLLVRNQNISKLERVSARESLGLEKPMAPAQPYF